MKQYGSLLLLASLKASIQDCGWMPLEQQQQKNDLHISLCLIPAQVGFYRGPGHLSSDTALILHCCPHL